MAKDVVEHGDQRKLLHLLNMEIRHISASKLTNLSLIVDQAKEWNRLIEDLSKPRVTSEGKLHSLNLSLEAINLINQQLYCGKSPTLALLNYWSITGRRRPTVKTLLYHLKECNLKRAEEYVYTSILGIEMPLAVQSPTRSQPKQLSDEFKFDDLENLLCNLKTQCPRYSFKILYDSTEGFEDEIYDPITGSGFKIGEGRFSSVYRVEAQGKVIAAKLLKSSCNEKFLVNEIDLIGKVKHENILELLGLAIDKYNICLIYPYMQNGSLFDCLCSGVRTMEGQPLPWKKRVEMTVGIARGIAYLHTYPEGSIIHRDIKSANILIDKDLTAKIGDFTLVRQNSSTETTQATQNIIGTSVYMPPEAFRGDISVKFDTFSFGVVLLELLTGLKPFNEDLQEDLLTYISDNLPDKGDGQDSREKFIVETLDKKAGDWYFMSALQLFELALMATDILKRTRPEMPDILSKLETISQS